MLNPELQDARLFPHKQISCITSDFLEGTLAKWMSAGKENSGKDKRGQLLGAVAEGPPEIKLSHLSFTCLSELFLKIH